MSIDKASKRLDSLVTNARQQRKEREQGYREKALKLFPWICGRCAREFNRQNLSQLTVHHRDHNHDNNPSDGSNWELLCLYCHDNEHSRYTEVEQGNTSTDTRGGTATHNPFADLGEMMKGHNKSE